MAEFRRLRRMAKTRNTEIMSAEITRSSFFSFFQIGQAGLFARNLNSSLGPMVEITQRNATMTTRFIKGSNLSIPRPYQTPPL